MEQVRAIADEITDLVLEFGGTISSEHGDGRARSPFLERMYGPHADAGVPPAQDGLRSRRPDEPRQHRGLARHPGEPPLRRRLQDVGAHHAARLLRRRAASRRRSRCATAWAPAARSSRARCARRTWPRATRSTPRAGAPTRCARCSRAGAAGGVHGQAALRGDGPVPGVQGLQGRVPGQRRHGQDEVRVPATTTTRPTGCRCATGSSGASSG